MSQSRSAERTTLTWTAFSSSRFTQTDGPLSETLQFSTPLVNSISSWPEQQADITRKLKKRRKSLQSPAIGWDTEPIMGAGEWHILKMRDHHLTCFMLADRVQVASLDYIYHFWWGWTRNPSRSVSSPPSPVCSGSRSPTHRQSYQAEEKTEKKVSLCVLSTIFIANHVGRKRPLHATLPPSEPICFKFRRRPKSQATGTSASTPAATLVSKVSNSLIDVRRWDSRKVECVVAVFVVYVKQDRTKMNETVVFCIE